MYPNYPKPNLKNKSYILTIIKKIVRISKEIQGRDPRRPPAITNEEKLFILERFVFTRMTIRKCRIIFHQRFNKAISNGFA